MKTARKAILLVLCAIALVVSAVMGTLAYFTDSKAVTNTFTVGKVYIELDEFDIDNDENKADNTTVNNETRDKANEYHLLPGQSYKKDPTVHVEADSENAWLFVEVLNEIKLVEAETVAGGYTSIEDQIKNNGWTLLEGAGKGASKVYYQAHAKADTVKDYVVFSNFKIDGNKAVPNGKGDGTNTFNITDFGKAKVNVTAYAIQEAGFENNPTGAWTALQGQLAANS